MGNGQSHTSTAYLKAVGAPPMFPSKRSKQEYKSTASSKSVVSMTRPMSKPPFSCTWSVHYPPGPSPVSRCGQCQIYDEQTDSLVIAYGVNPAGEFLNDMWILDLNTLVWRLVPAKLHQPRTNARAIKFNREMLIFGGSCGRTYFSDLHSVNLDTGVVTNFDSSPVSPRENVLLFVNEDSLFVWSGFCDQISIELDIFDFESRKWSVRDLERETGRRAATFVADPNNECDYIFGSTKGHPVTRFDREKQSFEVMKCLGTAPPPELTNAMLAIAGSLMFVFGGEYTDSNYSYLYALDLNRLRWFPFYVLPDNNTTSYEDGEISKQEIFKLPRQHSGCFAYSKKRRSLISTMGSLFLEPSPISIINVGSAIGILNHRSDLLDMLDFDPA